MSEKLAPPVVPCGSCPYRRDVPAGIWHPEEYAKLPAYDGETWEQPPGVFMCHQGDGSICGGWLLAHDRTHLLALRIAASRLDPLVWTYDPDVRVFDSGQAVARHGLSGVDAPSAAAVRKMRGIEKLRNGS